MKARDWQFIRSFVIFAVAAFLLLQLWPRDQTNPPIQSEPIWDSPETEQLARRACFDCHSHETEWPWYTAIVPISSLLEHDVRKGREVYNFSDWDEGCCTAEAIDRMAAIVGRRQMPFPYYVIMHPEADLTDIERGQLVYGLIDTMENGPTGSE